MVRVVGLEPTRLTAQEPKSCVSTNSTIPAYLIFPLFLLGEGIPEAERCARSASIKTGYACFYLANRKFFTEVTAPKSPVSANSIMPAYSLSRPGAEVYHTQLRPKSQFIAPTFLPGAGEQIPATPPGPGPGPPPPGPHRRSGAVRPPPPPARRSCSWAPGTSSPGSCPPPGPWPV